MDDIEELAAHYAYVFNEPDGAARQAAVAKMWSSEARMYTAANEFAGLAAITQRVVTAHEKFIVGQGCAFRALGPAQYHHDGVRVRWEMLPADGGDALSGGTQFLILGPDRRIQADYQVIDF